MIILGSPLYSYADNVTMAFGNRIVPYSFPETDTGIEIDIIRAALAYKGHTLKPHYYNLASVPKAFIDEHVDAAMTDLGKNLEKQGGFYAQPAVIYENALISLTKRKLSINQPSDLKGLSVVSFQGAYKRYPDWLSAVKINQQYYETAQQQLQVIKLLTEEYDLVLSDINIFQYYFTKMLAANGVQKKAIRIHNVFETHEADYRPIFRNAAVRDDFNVGLKAIRASGQYQQIYNRYLSPLESQQAKPSSTP